MQGLRSKAAALAITALMASLPTDEGERFKPYVDIAGIKTVCYGHTGKDIENRLYTKQECEEILRKDIIRHMKVVESCTKREIPASMLVAFTSFDFNTGGFCVSRARREFDAGRNKESCNALAYGPTGKPAWSYVNGNTFVNGLFQRRLRERSKCLENA